MELNIQNNTEQYSLEDLAFYTEIEEFVATLPEPSSDELERSSVKFKFLESIHNEIESVNRPKPQVGDDYNPSGDLSYKYIEHYDLSVR